MTARIESVILIQNVAFQRFGANPGRITDDVIIWGDPYPPCVPAFRSINTKHRKPRDHLRFRGLFPQ